VVVVPGSRPKSGLPDFSIKVAEIGNKPISIERAPE